MGGAIQVGAELHAFFAYLAQFVEAEDLKAARVGQHGPRPGDESMESPKPAYQLVARSQVEVVGVGENDLRVQLFEQMLRNCLDGPGCADGHEGRGLDQPMRQRHRRSPRLTTDGFYLKSERHVGDSSLGLAKGCLCTQSLAASFYPTVFG